VLVMRAVGKLSRQMSTPALMSCSMTRSSLLAGPIVAMIFVCASLAYNAFRGRKKLYSKCLHHRGHGRQDKAICSSVVKYRYDRCRSARANWPLTRPSTPLSPSSLSDRSITPACWMKSAGAECDAHPCTGCRISIKDLIDVEDVPTTAARVREGRIAHTDAAVVARLRDAGAVIIGKTNLTNSPSAPPMMNRRSGPCTIRTILRVPLAAPVELGSRRRGLSRVGVHRHGHWRIHPHSCRRLWRRGIEALIRRNFHSRRHPVVSLSITWAPSPEPCLMPGPSTTS
jgi:hypothetical protein